MGYVKILGKYTTVLPIHTLMASAVNANLGIIPLMANAVDVLQELNGQEKYVAKHARLDIPIVTIIKDAFIMVTHVKIMNIGMEQCVYAEMNIFGLMVNAHNALMAPIMMEFNAKRVKLINARALINIGMVFNVFAFQNILKLMEYA